jgi:hypothetical protein
MLVAEGLLGHCCNKLGRPHANLPLLQCTFWPLCFLSSGSTEESNKNRSEMLFWVVVLEYPQRKNKMTFCSDSFIFVLLYLEDIYRIIEHIPKVGSLNSYS